MIVLPKIGLGCFPLSIESINDKDALATIAIALDVGYRLFNTANTYGKGRSERLLGKALSKKRKDVIIISKGGCTEDYKHCATLEGIIKSCEESLRRLNTDYLDIYELHEPDPSVPIEESMGAFVKLRKEGKIRYAGISKATLEEIERADKVIDLTTVELEYSIRVRSVEEEIIPWCEKNEKYLLAYVPLGRGYLTEKLLPELNNLEPYNDLYQGKELEKTVTGSKKLIPLARELGCTLAQLSLAYLLNKSGRQVIPIPGAIKPWQVEENYGALDIKLDKFQIGRIEVAFS